MVFLAKTARLVFELLPQAIVFPLVFFILLGAILLVRRRAVERRFLGRPLTPFVRELAVATVMGVLAGYAGTLILVCLGIVVDIRGLTYIFPVALLLMLIDLRYLCLAYAGGLLSLCALLTGIPKFYIPGLLGLIAVLHLTESGLIMAGGHRQALPVYIAHEGRTMGGYLLQQVWPVPLLVLTAITTQVTTGVVFLREPAWWPLISLNLAGAADLILAPVPAAAALGYSDLALTSSPRVKAVRTAVLLGLYSAVLLALAVVSARVQAVLWVAALFAPGGHELVLHLTRWMELRGKPAFAPTVGGVRILAVLPGTVAANAGLHSGETIVALNDQPVRSKFEFTALISSKGSEISITIAPCQGCPGRRLHLRTDVEHLGLILTPDPDEPAQINMGRRRSFLGRRRAHS